MSIKYKTKKTKKARKFLKRRGTKKLYGGKAADVLKAIPESKVSTPLVGKESIKELDKPLENSSQKRSIEEIQAAVEEAHKPKPLPSLEDLANLPVVKETGTLLQGVTTGAVENLGNLVGIDVTNPEQTEEKLNEIKDNLTDPKKLEIIGEIAKDVGAVAIKTATELAPVAEPLVNTLIESGTKAADKIGKSGVKVVLNTAEEIPGVGVVLGTLRSLSNIGEAMISSINAGSEMLTATADATNVSTQVLKQNAKENEATMERINDSINELKETDTKAEVNIPEGKQPEDLSKEKKILAQGGGTKFRFKRGKKKTKKVRFAI